MTPDADRRLLLQVARDAIVAHITGTITSLPPDELLTKAGAAFVTIHKQGELRGCIGHVEANEPLGRVVARCAVAACSLDPRFPALVADELPHIDIELSLLTPLELIAGPGDIEIGRHGLVVEKGSQRGLLLPQVALEWKWDAPTFLAQTCHKAGLPRDAWKEGAQLWRFEAEVFGETLHHGGH